MVTVLALAVLSQTSSLPYADSLYRQGEVYRAAGEYHRWLFENPTADERPKALLGLGKAYLKGKRYADAERILRQVPEASPLSPLARYSLAEAQLGLGRETEAKQLLLELPDTLRGPAAAQLGLLAARKGDWRTALGQFEANPSLASLAQRRLDTPERDPAIAAALSLVPGGGQLYLGRHSDALNAFLFTAVTGLASSYYFSRGNNVLGGTAAALSLSFWGGSIYGAAVEARRVNQQTAHDFLQRATEQVEALRPE
ncbi:Anaphase-promoting complex, cyclosome, subunit 3 [compost metagenome]